jgi:hypothetical protein
LTRIARINTNSETARKDARLAILPIRENQRNSRQFLSMSIGVYSWLIQIKLKRGTLKTRAFERFSNGCEDLLKKVLHPISTLIIYALLDVRKAAETAC